MKDDNFTYNSTINVKFIKNQLSINSIFPVL